MTIIKVPLPQEKGLIEIVISVDATIQDTTEDQQDRLALILERAMGKYLNEMLRSIGVKELTMLQD